mmetsp:Transcript_7767/g.22034  ORF Transcript_7767/g.22034 Transcript_7767/m.22034 type:complete len:253 (+) Transcript_7767:267-1025(+)
MCKHNERKFRHAAVLRSVELLLLACLLLRCVEAPTVGRLFLQLPLVESPGQEDRLLLPGRSMVLESVGHIAGGVHADVLEHWQQPPSDDPLVNVLGKVVLDGEDVGEPTFDDAHAAFRQGPCFVGANVCSVPHGLARRQHADQVLLFVHLLRGVGKGDGHCEGKTLGDGHDNDGDRDNERIYDAVAPLGRARVVNGNVDDGDEEGEEGGAGAKVANDAHHVLELLLERGGSLLLLQSGLDLAPLRVLSDGDH